MVFLEKMASDSSEDGMASPDLSMEETPTSGAIKLKKPNDCSPDVLVSQLTFVVTVKRNVVVKVV